MDCTCKKKICAQCRLCSKCSCACVTISCRNRGRPSKARKRKRRSICYRESSDTEVENSSNEGATRTVELKDLLELLGLSNLLHNLPNSRKTLLLAAADPKEVRRCDVVLPSVMESVCHLLYSADGNTYFDTRHKHNSNMELGGECLNSLLQAIGETKRGSLERRLLRGFLCAHMPLKTLNKLAKQRNKNTLDGNGLDDAKVSEEVVGHDEVVAQEGFSATRSRGSTCEGVVRGVCGGDDGGIHDNQYASTVVGGHNDKKYSYQRIPRLQKNLHDFAFRLGSCPSPWLFNGKAATGFKRIR